MSVIPLHPRRTSSDRPRAPGSYPVAGIRGSFRAPSGRTGTMTGSLRVERLLATSDRLWAEGVFTGALVDADGSHIGTASRRQRVPAVVAHDLEGHPVVIGPAEVDLIGLTVAVPAITVDAAGQVGAEFGPAEPAGPSRQGTGR